MRKLFIFIALLALLTSGSLQAQIVGADERHEVSKSSTPSVYQSTNHCINFEWEYIKGFRVSYGYQINPNFSIGAGIGSFIPNKDTYSSTITSGYYVFSDVIYNYPLSNEWSLFAKLRIDLQFYHVHHSYDSTDDFNYQLLIAALQPGVKYKNFSLGIGRYGYLLELDHIDFSHFVYSFYGINFTYSLPIRKQ